jgi:hypothetical protein
MNQHSYSQTFRFLRCWRIIGDHVIIKLLLRCDARGRKLIISHHGKSPFARADKTINQRFVWSGFFFRRQIRHNPRMLYRQDQTQYVYIRAV